MEKLFSREKLLNSVRDLYGKSRNFRSRLKTIGDYFEFAEKDEGVNISRHTDFDEYIIIRVN